MDSSRRLGIAAFLAFLACIPLANWMIGHVGTVCVPQGPCLIPVAPGLMAPSGVLTVGFALVLRDIVQRCLGIWWGLGAIVLGTLLSAALAPGALVLASGVAFLLSECADFAVYTPLQRRGLVRCGACLGGGRIAGRQRRVPLARLRQPGVSRRARSSASSGRC